MNLYVDNLCKSGAASPTPSKNRPDRTYRCALAFHEHWMNRGCLALLAADSSVYMLFISARVPRGQDRGENPPLPFAIPIARMFR
jgi:hypothetical protein